MASFLSGLMGGLKGVGHGMAQMGRGLMGGIDDAVGAGTPGGAATVPGTGGAVPVAAEKPGFLKRINTVNPETGYSTLDKIGQLGAMMTDFDDGGTRAAAYDTRAAGRVKEGKAAEAQRQMAAMIDEQFPDDPRMQFLLKANPEAATKALAEVEAARRKPITEKVDDRFAFVDPFAHTVDYSDARGPTYAEETGRGRLEHDVQQDDREFNLEDWYKHDQARRQWEEHRARLRGRGGYGTPGVGGIGGPRVLGSTLPEDY